MDQNRNDQAELDRVVTSLEWDFVDGEERELPARAWSERNPGLARAELVVQGLVRLRGDDEPVDLAAGDLVFFPTGARHELHALSDARLLSSQMSSTLSGAAVDALPTRMLLIDFARYEPLAETILRDMVANVRIRPANAICDRTATLLASMILRSWLERGCAPTRWLMHVDDPDLARAVGAIHADPGRAWTVPELAQIALASRSGFAQRFRQAVGQTPSRYLTSVRLDKAQQILLRNDLSISEVADRLGYGSNAAFSRAFSRRTGVTPSQWQRQARFRKEASGAGAAVPLPGHTVHRVPRRKEAGSRTAATTATAATSR